MTSPQPKLLHCDFQSTQRFLPLLFFPLQTKRFAHRPVGLHESGSVGASVASTVGASVVVAVVGALVSSNSSVIGTCSQTSSKISVTLSASPENLRMGV